MTAPSLRPIPDQVVVVVGAASGIGRQTALRFGERRARLVVAARDDVALASLLRDLRDHGAPEPVSVVADVRDPAAMEAVAQRAIEAFGRIDSWVHVAGIDLWATFEETTPAEFRDVIEINLLGPAHGAMAALPRLRDGGGGALIVVSSVEADVPLPYQAAYAASKHGVSGMLRSLRMELAAEGAPIAVTQIQPAGIDTPLFRGARTRLGVEPRPAPPVYDPDVVAEVILHAAEHPSRELFAGGFGWVLALSQRIAPRLNEAILARVGRPLQRTSIPKSDRGPSNLEGPITGVEEVRGGYGGRAFSILNRVQMVPAPARMAALAGVGLAGWFALRRRD
jgi:NAD(P)-dependent dehydrogenase (short-subunit alcohol dehydrogenase family)